MPDEDQYLTDDAASMTPRSVVAELAALGERMGAAFVYSSAHLAVVSVVEVVLAMALLSVPASPAPAVGGLVTFAVYTGDHLSDLDAEEVSDPERAAFLYRHRGALYVLGAAAYSVGVALSVLGGPVALFITLLPGVFWLVYASNWVPRVVASFRRLKEVLLVNTALVALAWATSLTFLPLAYADRAVTPTAVAVFGYFFLRSFVDTEIPNVFDAATDRAAGVATLPVTVGVAWTRRALYGVDLLTGALVAGATAGGLLAPVLAAPLLLGVGYSLGVTALLGRADVGETLSVAAEFEYLLVAVALLVTAG